MDKTAAHDISPFRSPHIWSVELASGCGAAGDERGDAEDDDEEGDGGAATRAPQKITAAAKTPTRAKADDTHKVRLSAMRLMALG